METPEELDTDTVADPGEPCVQGTRGSTIEPQDLWKFFLRDKIGMAVLLAVAGYLFSRTLEVIKCESRQFKSELGDTTRWPHC